MRETSVIHPIPPLYDSQSEILILGSFPSVKSREAQFFYGHPQNRFWKVIAAVCGEPVPETVPEKKALLLGYQNRLDSGSVAKARARQEKVKESYMSAALERAAARDPSKGIEGMTFVVGGKLSFWDSRKELQTYLEPYGAKLASSVTKQTDYLVTEESDGNSEKILKAQKLGVAIINEEELNHIIGRRFKDAVSIEVPGWIKRIESSAFTDCPSLTKVTISNGVTSISGFPFYGLCGLTDVTIPESVTSIGGNVFTKCPNVRIHAPSGSYAEQYAKAHNIPFVAE